MTSLAEIYLAGPKAVPPAPLVRDVEGIVRVHGTPVCRIVEALVAGRTRHQVRMRYGLSMSELDLALIWGGFGPPDPVPPLFARAA